MTLHVRSASLINYANLAREAGLDPLAMLAEAGLQPEVLDNPGIRIPGVRVRALLEASARRSGWQDFGLRLAETRQFWVLGPLALAVREQATLGPALTLLVRHIRLHNESLHLWLQEEGASVMLHLDYTGGVTRQSLELSMGMVMRFLYRALPAGWQPLNVCLTHSPPADLRVAHRVLGRRVEYGALANGIVFRKSDMELPMATQARLDAYTRQYVQSLMSSTTTSTTALVRRLALILLPAGQCTLPRIASHMGVDARTVDRRLAREGTQYGALMDQIRSELVRQYLVGRPRKQAEIATLLGFSGATVFSRWFRRQFGCTPLEWVRSNPLPPPSDAMGPAVA